MFTVRGIYDAAFWFAVFFMVGIGLASLKVSFPVILALILILIFFILFRDKESKLIYLTPVVFIGFFYFIFYVNFNSQDIPFGETRELNAIVVSDPIHGFGKQSFTAKLDPPLSGSIKIYTSETPEVSYGNKLRIKGEIIKDESGSSGISIFPKIEIIGKDFGYALKRLLFKVKRQIISNLRLLLPIDKSALATGILLGDREDFTDDMKLAMQKSGTTHIVALSGFNISIIGILLSNAFLKFTTKSKAFLFSFIGILLFVLMTGAESSVVRAAIMGIIAMIGEQSSRVYNVRNAITLTALVMVIYNPTYLVFDVGFQLSFLALMGLVNLEPRIRRIVSVSNDDKSVLKKNFIQTISAQIAVTPIILASFGTFSIAGIFANTLILEFIPITMLFIFITAIISFLFLPLAATVGWLVSLLLGYEIFIIHFFSFSWL